MNEHQLPWDDLRTVLAIARAGSLSGAARALGVSHATVYRRLGGIEQRLALRLFERGRAGYAPTSAGDAVAAAAARIEAEVSGIERRLAGRTPQPSGQLCVTTTDTLLEGLLSPIFADFRAEFSAISLDVVISNQLFSLSRREADVALRPTRSPPENLVGRRVADIAQAVYGSRRRFPADGAPIDLSRVEWVGADERMAYLQLDAWMKRHGLHRNCHYRVDTLQGMRAGVRDDLGVAVLPCYLGDADTTLVRLGGPIAELTIDLWLLTHPDLARAARIRAFTEFVSTRVRRQEHQLAGAGA